MTTSVNPSMLCSCPVTLAEKQPPNKMLPPPCLTVGMVEMMPENPFFFNLVLTKGLSSSLLRIICRSLKRALQSTPTPALWRSTSLLLMSFDRSLAWEKLFLWTSVFLCVDQMGTEPISGIQGIKYFLFCLFYFSGYLVESLSLSIKTKLP